MLLQSLRPSIRVPAWHIVGAQHLLIGEELEGRSIGAEPQWMNEICTHGNEKEVTSR